MWPLTWGADGNIYTAAGDNQGSPLNVWKVSGYPHFFSSVYNDPLDAIKMELLDNMPLHPAVYCNGEGVMPEFGIKPSGIISVGGVLYMGVSNGRYGQEKDWYRQIYTNAWIVTSTDLGKTWNREATERRFFEGRLGAPSFSSEKTMRVQEMNMFIVTLRLPKMVRHPGIMQTFCCWAE